MTVFETLVDFLNNFIWTYIMIAMLLGAAIWFSIKTRFVQFRKIGEMFFLLGEGAAKGIEKNQVSSFQAFCISLASRVGTGNLAGVATAVAIGGPGAVFWMWIIAILGAASAFIESTLAQMFKVKGKDSYIGGPAYYIQRGLGLRWMAILFAVCITVTFGLIFNSLQANTIALAFQDSFSIDPIWIGIIISALTLTIIFGGVHRIAIVSGVIVPIMALLYIFLAIGIVLFNIEKLPGVISLIIENAFGLEQTIGGGVGAALMQGIRRGLFSNEAGLGSAPNAAATAYVSHPVKQGLIQTLGVFTDTLIICTCTAFIILFSDLHSTTSLNGIQLTQAALSSEIGSIGSTFVSIAILFFAFTSILGNYYYGEANILFFTKKRWVMTSYRLLVGVMTLGGSLISLQLVWNLADISMAIMGIVNLIAILLLGKYAIKALKDYNSQKRIGIKSPIFRASSIPDIEDKLTCWPK
ncbi:MAG: alanine/glycine:cation symporter family protein [Bacteroidales bacterium]|nr:alanine/glycine:cation symporter family protein [Bacteroidales bacterium]